MAVDLTPLFEPRGVIVTGVSSHPGKFGFVALHNILAGGYTGAVHPVGREPGRVLGHQVLGSIDEVPEGSADLLFVCTPAAINEDLLRRAAGRGVRAAYIAAGGYREAGEDGTAAERRLVEIADELGLLLAGPNGQGLVSTPARLCAQIVAPDAQPGPIAIASQSGNLCSTFLNLSNRSGIGVSRAVAVGNGPQLSVVDYLEWFASDPQSAVSLVYLESVDDGRDLFERLRRITPRKPVVVLKGGASSAGARAAASHTGALASDHALFTGMAEQAGVVLAADVDEAFDAAASLATQPLPEGGRVVVVTTAGGWGVATVDALATTGLEVIELPPDLEAAIDEKLPPRWSRSNPIDMAGGETRDTIPEVLDLVATHPQVDAIVYLGLGIQSNTAAQMRAGGFHPDHGLDRIVDYHERQDTRFAAATAEITGRTGTPIVVATELATTAPDNPGPTELRRQGRYCHPSAARAVRSLHHLAWRAQWLRRRAET